MRRLSLLSAAAGVAVTALAATSPAEAAFHLIRWEGSGFCQIWDESIPTVPYPSNYVTVSESVPTFGMRSSSRTACCARGRVRCEIAVGWIS
jgi:hypothetical protein